MSTTESGPWHHGNPACVHTHPSSWCALLNESAWLLSHRARGMSIVANTSWLYHTDLSSICGLPLSHLSTHGCSVLLKLEDMQNEVKFSSYAETSNYVTDIDLEEFIKLYVNHRPASGISIQELCNAFQLLGKPDEGSRYSVDRDELLELLQARGKYIFMSFISTLHVLTCIWETRERIIIIYRERLWLE